MLSGLLTPNGVIVVAENMFDGFGGTNIPSHTIWSITSVRNPSFVKLARRFFNTAGVGVCFQSENSWRRIFGSAGLTVSHHFFGIPWSVSPTRRVAIGFLGLKGPRHGHFLLKPAAVA